MLLKKISTAAFLVRRGKFSDFYLILVRRLVHIQKFRFVELDLDTYKPRYYKARIPLDYKLASLEDMDKLFDAWPDSEEEFRRHYEVFYNWGLRTCLIFFHRDTGDIVHMQFVLTEQDIANIRQFLPLQIYGYLKSDQEAFVEWTYTFQKYRFRGIALEAMEKTLDYCKDKGIRKVFSHMSESNKNSLGLFRRIGFVQTATITQIRMPWQDKHAGIYLKKRIKKD